MSGLFKRPKVPEPTQQEIASVARQQRALDEETGKNERRLKAVARGRLGSSSLLASASTATGSSASGSSSGNSSGYTAGRRGGGAYTGAGSFGGNPFGGNAMGTTNRK